MDRHSLSYLNPIEKVNCVYCGYFKGLIAYVQEIAARTEQFWCSIKHARKLAGFHKRYHKFFDYGDHQAYRQKLEQFAGISAIWSEYGGYFPAVSPMPVWGPLDYYLA
jgi:hypothetical protein